MAMHVIFPGPRTTIQDRGRLGYQNSGFAPGGFIDRVASEMANLLVGNEASEAVLEFCLMGPTLQFDETVNIAVCGGDFEIVFDGMAFSADKAVRVPAGSTVKIKTGKTGIYGSIAVGGGLDIPVVMGSRSTNLRCGIGGFEGRALQAGDTIGLRDPGNGKKDMSWRWVPSRKLISPDDHEVAKVRVIAGPQEEMFTEEGLRTFYGSAYEITALSDRMGYRLEGPKVEAADGYDILSDGIVNGSVQDDRRLCQDRHGHQRRHSSVRPAPPRSEGTVRKNNGPGSAETEPGLGQNVERALPDAGGERSREDQDPRPAQAGVGKT